MTYTLDTTKQKWRSLVDKLLFNTKESQISWKKSADEDTYITIIGRTPLSIEEGTNSQFRHMKNYTITMYKEDGEAADSFSNEDLQDSFGNSYHTKMRDLYKIIARINSGSEKILDNVLNNLLDEL